MNIELSPDTESTIIGEKYTPKQPELSENEKKGLLYGSLIAAGIHAAAGGLRGGLGEAAIQGLSGGFTSYAGGQEELYKQKKNEEASRIQWQRQEDLVNYRKAMQTLGMEKATMQNQLGYDNLDLKLQKMLQDAEIKQLKTSKDEDPYLNFRKWHQDYSKALYKARGLKPPSEIDLMMNPELKNTYEQNKLDYNADLEWLDKIGKERFPDYFKKKGLVISKEEQQIKTQQNINKAATGIFERATQGQTTPAQTGTPQQSFVAPPTVYNPKTGQRLILKDGKWQPTK